MADVEIGGLVVRFKGDTTDLTTKMDNVGKQSEQQASRVNRAFEKVNNIMALTSAGFVTMAGVAVAKASEWGNAVDDLSDKTGLSGQEASKLLVIAKSVGVGLEEANAMFARFSRSVYLSADAFAKAAAEGKESDDVLTRLGISALNADGSMRSTLEVFNDVKDALQDMEDGWQKTSLEMELFGRSGTDMHDMLHMTNEEIQNAINKAQAMGLIISSETAAGWEKFERQLRSTKGTFNTVSIQIGNELLPQVKDMIDSVQNVTKAFVSLDPQTRSNIFSIAKLGAEIGIASTVITKTIGAVDSMAKSLGIMRLATISAAGPWVALAAAIGLTAKATLDYYDSKNKVEGYDPKAEIYADPNRPGKHLKKQWVDEAGVTELGTTTGAYIKVALSEEEEAAQTNFIKDKEKTERELKELENKLKDFNTGKFIGGGVSNSNGGSENSPTPDQLAQEEVNLWRLKVEAGKVGQEEYLAILDKFAKDESLLEQTRLQFFIDAKTIRANTDKETTDKEKSYHEALHSFMLAKDKNYSDTYRNYLAEQVEKAKSAEGEKSAAYISAQRRLFEFDQSTQQEREQATREYHDFRLSMDKEYASEYSRYLWKNVEELRKAKGAESQEYMRAYFAATQFDKRLADEKAAAEKRIIDQNASMLADLITNTRSAHDILKAQWRDFVQQIIAEQWKISAGSNVFSSLLGGIFGLNKTKSNSAWTLSNGVKLDPNFGYKISAAGGFDIPDIPGDIPIFAHRKEMVLPADLSEKIRNMTDQPTAVPHVTVNQTFNGQQDPSVVSQIRQQASYIKGVVIDAINNESSMRNAIKGAVK